MAGNKVNNKKYKFEVEKFNGKGNFSMWQRRIKATLVKEELHKVIFDNDKKHVDIIDDAWDDISKSTMSIRAMSSAQGDVQRHDRNFCVKLSLKL